jgi:polysaccharide export outer membrane protein
MNDTRREQLSPSRRLTGGLLAPLLVLLALVLPAGANAQANDGYRLGSRDRIQVRVFEEPRLDVDVEVADDGTIRLPLVGNVEVEGLTVAEATQRLKEILERDLLQRASVSLAVTDYLSRPISVLGAVAEPGSLNVSGRISLIEALVAAGGLGPSHGDTIYVLRRSANGLTDQVAISVQGLMIEADPSLNIPIFPNDLVNVPPTLEVTVYCMGEVAQPGAMTFKSTERITLLAALARAGGLTDRASKKILIKRQSEGGEPVEVEIDYRRIMSGRAVDPELQEGDVVVVRESFF